MANQAHFTSDINELNSFEKWVLNRNPSSYDSWKQNKAYQIHDQVGDSIAPFFEPQISTNNTF